MKRYAERIRALWVEPLDQFVLEATWQASDLTMTTTDPRLRTFSCYASLCYLNVGVWKCR
jgi:hypothetical protein